MLPTGRIIVSLHGTELLPIEATIIAHPMIAGIILFTKNFNSKKQLITLIDSIKTIVDLPIFVDQEGGWVQRLGRNFTTPLPCPEVFGTAYDLNKDVGLQLAYHYGKKMAEPLKELGIISLAPVLDLDAGNKVITDLGRAFHKNPIICALLAESYIDGMHSVSMGATGKHFPGHGQNVGDSHDVAPSDDRIFEEIAAEDLYPFEYLIGKNKLSAIMPAHITYPKIDPANTAGMSKIWLEDILRKKYKFNGIIISDCLSMKGAGDLSLVEKTKKALKYGDLGLLCNRTPEEFLEVLDKLNTEEYKMTDLMQKRFENWIKPSKKKYPSLIPF